MAAAKDDRMTDKEIAAESGPLYDPGRAYQWVLAYGWVLVGYYVRHETPMRIRVAHASYYRVDRQTHAKLCTEGAAPNVAWHYLGSREITAPHILHAGPYCGEVHRVRTP